MPQKGKKTTAADERSKAIEIFRSLPGITKKHAESLYSKGYRTLADISKASDKELAFALGGDNSLAHSIKSFASDLEDIDISQLTEIEAGASQALKSQKSKEQDAPENLSDGVTAGNEPISKQTDKDEPVEAGKSRETEASEDKELLDELEALERSLSAGEKKEAAAEPEAAGREPAREEDLLKALISAGAKESSNLEEELNELDRELESIDSKQPKWNTPDIKTPDSSPSSVWMEEPEFNKPEHPAVEKTIEDEIARRDTGHDAGHEAEVDEELSAELDAELGLPSSPKSIHGEKKPSAAELKEETVRQESVAPVPVSLEHADVIGKKEEPTRPAQPGGEIFTKAVQTFRKESSGEVSESDFIKPAALLTNLITCRRCGNKEVDMDRAICTKCRTIVPFEDYRNAYRQIAGKSGDAITKYERAILFADLPEQTVDMIIRIDSGLSINPYDHRLWYRRGKLLEENKRYEDALRCYDEAVKSNPLHRKSWEAKAFVLAKLGRYLDVKIAQQKLSELPDIADEDKSIDELLAEYTAAQKPETDKTSETSELESETAALLEGGWDSAGPDSAEVNVSSEGTARPRSSSIAEEAASAESGTKSEIEAEIERRKTISASLKTASGMAQFKGKLTESGGIEGAVGRTPLKGTLEGYRPQQPGNISAAIDGHGRIEGIVDGTDGTNRISGLIDRQGKINGIVNGVRVTGRLLPAYLGQGKIEGRIDKHGRIIGTLNGKKVTGQLIGYTGSGGKLEATLDGRASVDGLINGKKRFSGLINGKGRINGVISGKRVGGVLYAVDGAKMHPFHGIVNGMRGHINGLINGKGTTNGVVNGRINGRINGKINGHINGRINGLINGRGAINGVVNGITSPVSHIRKRGSSRGRVRDIIIVSVIILSLIATLFLLYLPGEAEQGIVIDGSFSDWSNAPKNLKSSAGTNPDIDITEYSIDLTRGKISFYLRVRGTMLAGQQFESADGTIKLDTVRIFIDSDADASSGYNIFGIGSDHMVEIYGCNNRVVESTLSVYNPDDDNPDYAYNADVRKMDWNAWTQVGSVRASVSEDSLEAQLYSYSLGLKNGEVRVLYHTTGHDGAEDRAESIVSTSSPSIYVYQESADKYAYTIQPSQEAPILKMKIKAFSSDLTVTGITLRVQGTADLKKAGMFRAASPSGAAFSGYVSGDGTVTLLSSSGGLAVAKNTVLTLDIYADLSGMSPQENGKSFGARITSVTTSEKTVLLLDSDTTNIIKSVYQPGLGIAVDGAFGDWSAGRMLKNDTIGDCLIPSVDIVQYGATRESGAFYFYLKTSGDILSGDVVPAPVKSIRSGQQPQPAKPDSDRDTMPDESDPYPYDFNNDGIDDANTGNDADDDGIKDYPYGPDSWLNTTIPISNMFPSEYRGKIVSVYIGKKDEPSSRKPCVTGEDYVYAFIDADSDAATGYCVSTAAGAECGAEYVINISGRSGSAVAGTVMIFTGSNPGEWNWKSTNITVDTGIAGKSLETAVDFAGIGDSRLIHGNISLFVAASDWSGDRDETTLIPLVVNQPIKNYASNKNGPASASTESSFISPSASISGSSSDSSNSPFTTPTISFDDCGGPIVPLATVPPVNMFCVYDVQKMILDSSSKMASYRFTAQSSFPVDKIRVYIVDAVGTAPTYRFGLQSDDSNEDHKPSGTYLASGTLAPSAAGWVTVTLDSYCSITQGIIYHLVIQHESGTVDGSNYCSFGHTGPHNKIYPNTGASDVYSNTLSSSDGGTSWSANDMQPVYILEKSSNPQQYEGNPYHTYSSRDIYGTNTWGSKFTISGSHISVVRLYAVIRKVGTPSAGCDIVLRDMTGGTNIAYGTVAADDIGTDYGWEYVSISETTLVVGGTYAIFLRSSGADSSNYYQTPSAETLNEAPYKGLTFDGTDAVEVQNPDDSAVDSENRDIPFHVPDIQSEHIRAGMVLIAPPMVFFLFRSARSGWKFQGRKSKKSRLVLLIAGK